MKKLFAIILVSTSTLGFAQEADSSRFRKHEIGFGFTNIYSLFSFQGAYTGYFVNQDDYGPTGFGYWATGYWGGYGSTYWDYGFNINPGYGLNYRYHLANNMAIRSGLDFSFTNTNNEGNQSSSFLGDSINSFNLKSTKLVVKVGYQFEKHIKKIMVYGGADVFYYSSTSDYDIDFSFNAYYDEKGTSSIRGFGVTPLGGVQFRIGSMFSISTEGRLRIGSYKSEGSYSGYNTSVGNYSGDNTGKSVETKFSPIGLISFNIHL